MTDNEKIQHAVNNALVAEKLHDLTNAISELTTQVKYTNGRVSNLERWMWGVSGGLVVVSIIVVPLFLNLFKN